MQLDSKKSLFDILKAAEDIERFTCELGHGDFSENAMVQAAVERKFEIIGEALNRIGQYDAPLLEHLTEHRRIIGFRNIIAHGYDVIDYDIVWDAVKNHLPKLKAEVEEILATG